MNYSTAVMLVNENIRAIKVAYEDMKENPHQRIYTYKTLDQNIKVDDLVVVPTDTRHERTVVKVVEVDVDIDFDDNIQIKWIIDRVDETAHDEIIEEEKKWIDVLKASEKRRKREELKKNMIDLYNDKDELDKLPIANMGGGDSALIEDNAESADE